jgi:hypothetical protein
MYFLLRMIWADVYSALYTHKVTVVGGDCSNVGVAGLILGGGQYYFFFFSIYLRLDSLNDRMKRVFNILEQYVRPCD